MILSKNYLKLHCTKSKMFYEYHNFWLIRHILIQLNLIELASELPITKKIDLTTNLFFSMGLCFMIILNKIKFILYYFLLILKLLVFF